VLDEVLGAINSEVKRLVGSKVKWGLTIEHVGKKDIYFYRYAIKKLGKGVVTDDDVITYRFQLLYRNQSPDDRGSGDPHMPTDLNLELARRLTAGDTVVVSADLVGLELDPSPTRVFYATLANLTFAE
jgi:hypothetical protein